MRRLINIICRDGSHAAKISRAASLQAGAALHRFTHQEGFFPGRRGRHRIGRAEDRDRGNIEGARHMHEPRVVADKDATA